MDISEVTIKGNSHTYFLNKKKENVRLISSEGYRPKTDSELVENVEDEGKQTSVSTVRRSLAQILATTAVNLVLFDLGMAMAFPTIAIPDLLNSKEELKFDEEEASWFGSITFICQPLGSVLAGLVFEPFGRKRTLFYTNFPLFTGWILMYFGSKVWTLYIGGAIMGIGIGFMEAPQMTYMGEIIEPKLRGVLIAYAELSLSLGFCFVYFLGTAINWKIVAAICSLVPVLALMALSQIPESPVWLLSQEKMEEAKSSLCWLRGWVRFDGVREEFSELVRHNEASYNENHGILDRRNEESSSENRKKSFRKRKNQTFTLEEITRKTILQPLTLIGLYFAISMSSGIPSTRPFMIEILREFQTPLSPKWVTVISSSVAIAGFVVCMIILPRTGKRTVSIGSALACALCNISISIYIYFSVHLNLPWIPVTLFILLNFFWSLGIGQIPWMLISELFPFRGRGLASGISAAISYVFAFIFTKTYYTMYHNITLPGVFVFYGSSCLFGALFLYYCLPETEGKTLEQIEIILENHFTNVFKKFKRNP